MHSRRAVARIARQFLDIFAMGSGATYREHPRFQTVAGSCITRMRSSRPTEPADSAEAAEVPLSFKSSDEDSSE
jgi:hypothetical protein